MLTVEQTSVVLVFKSAPCNGLFLPGAMRNVGVFFTQEV